MGKNPATRVFALVLTFAVFAIIPLKLANEKIVGQKTVEVEEPMFVEISTPSPTPTPSPTLPPILTPTPTPLPTATPTLKPTPVVLAPEELDSLFFRFAHEFGVDKQLLKRIAHCESSFNINAVNMDYLGLFQFSKASWASIRQLMGNDVDHDLRANPEEAIKTAAYAISIGRVSLWPNCK